MKMFFVILAICVVPSIASNPQPCPRNIKRYRAFPYSNPESRDFFYLCQSGKPPKLTKCKAGETYESGSETCQSKESDHMNYEKGSRVKRQFIGDGDMELSGDGDAAQWNGDGDAVQINQPTLGRNVRLGALYYGATDQIRIEQHLWNETTLKKSYKSNSPSSDYEVQVSEKALDRLNNFNIKASLGLSFMGGLINVEGSAKYLSDRRKSTKASSISLKYTSKRSTESLSQEFKTLDYPALCNRVGEKNGPTHVVTSIQRGFNGIFNFQLETKNTYANSKVSGRLKAVIDSIPSLKISAEADLNLTETETITGKDITTRFFGDTILESSPTNLHEAIQIYQTFPKLALRSTNVVSF